MNTNDTERELVRNSTFDCLECGDEFSGWQYGRYTAEEQGVCMDCYWGELSGEERMEYAKRSNRLRSQRTETDQ